MDRPNELPPISKTLDKTFKLYVEHVRTFLLVSAVVWVPATLLTAVFQRVAAHAFDAHLALALVAGIFPTIPVAVAFFVQGAAIDVAVASASLGQRPSVESAYVGALRKIVPIFVVSLLYGLVVLGGAILFVVPALIFACRYAFALPVVIVEGLTPVQAMSRSAVLTEGRKARLFLIFIVVGAVTGVLSSVGDSLFGWIQTPLLGALLKGSPSVLTAALCPMAVMLEYLAARDREVESVVL